MYEIPYGYGSDESSITNVIVFVKHKFELLK